MTTATSPIKVSVETDALIGHAAHFLGRPKKSIVDAAVVEYIQNHRDEINAAVISALHELDGTRAARVAMLAGLSREQLDDVGAVSDS